MKDLTVMNAAGLLLIFNKKALSRRVRPIVGGRTAPRNAHCVCGQKNKKCKCRAVTAQEMLFEQTQMSFCG